MKYAILVRHPTSGHVWIVAQGGSDDCDYKYAAELYDTKEEAIEAALHDIAICKEWSYIVVEAPSSGAI